MLPYSSLLSLKLLQLIMTEMSHFNFKIIKNCYTPSLFWGISKFTNITNLTSIIFENLLYFIIFDWPYFCFKWKLFGYREGFIILNLLSNTLLSNTRKKPFYTFDDWSPRGFKTIEFSFGRNVSYKRFIIFCQDNAFLKRVSFI